MNDVRYPIGKFQKAEQVTPELRAQCIQHIAEAPTKLKGAISGLSEAQLDTPYREGGWTVRQVVHHLADSHMNAYLRFKHALTEDKPTIKAYKENVWAEFIDSRTAPVDASMQILVGLHERWVMVLRGMKAEEFLLPFIHPERGEMILDFLLQLYAWHGQHHVAHITGLREKMGWVE